VGFACCGDEGSPFLFDDCDACATLFVDFVPAFGTLVFDSVCRKVTITCGNQTYDASKNLSTSDGLPFRWIELACQEACLTIEADCLNVADDATVTVKSSGREL
jgi:hypothetical protein